MSGLPRGVQAGTQFPDAPSSLLLRTLQSPSQTTPAQSGRATLTGTVSDGTGAAIPDALILLRGTGDVPPVQAATGDGGRFTIANLAPGVYTCTVSAPGFSPYVSQSFILRAGEQTLPPIALTVTAAGTTVQVTANQEQIAEAEVRAEEKQRVFGVFPDFYTSYTWDAAPLNAQQKFRVAAHSAFDPIAFLAVGGVAGVEQALDIYPAYHQGAEGYGKRYGASFADEAIGRFFASAIYPSVFHQDPRYFYKGPGAASKPKRALYAVSRALVTRSDSGRIVPNYSLLFGRLTAGAIANAYHPASDRGFSLTLINAVLNLGGHAADNFAREFFIRRFTPSVPSFANGQKSSPAP